ncbi:hypothetical protein IIA16_01965 [bacterium]|nr:hypothetical protein [bacterium]
MGLAAKARARPWLAATLIAAGLVVALRFAGDATVQKAEGYVESSVVKARAAFITLSVLKAALAVVEGSDLEVGTSAIVTVTADIEVGDAVQPVYDLVDIAWRVSMVAWATLEAQRILLVASDRHWPDYLVAFGVALAALAIWRAVPQGRTARRLGALLVLVGLGVRFLLPVTLVAAQAISTGLIGSRLTESQQALEELGAEMSDLQNILGEPGNPLERFNRIRDWMEAHGFDYWAALGERASQHAVTMVAAFLLDVIVLPLLVLALVWSLLKRVGRALLESSVAGVLGAAKSAENQP